MTRRPGFTLIELLIVTAVFSLVALVATTVITRIQSTQRQILGKQRVVADGRYVLETIARAVRQGSINYSFYPAAGPAGSQSTIALIDSTNVETCYSFSGNAMRVVSGAGVTKCVGVTPTNITPADLLITDFHVYITPGSDPFKPVPRQVSDCRQNPPITIGAGPLLSIAAGFDGGRGICACRNNVSTDCYGKQACVSTTSGTEGQTCGVGEAKCICQNENQQPQVTMVLSTKSNNTASGEQAKATIQTTVTSHLYRR